MGQTRARGFRDKLAMRTRARAAAIPCPEFVHALNHRAIVDWTQRIAPPWVLKPRSQAAAIGIRKLASHDELWRTLEELGDAQALADKAAGDLRTWWDDFDLLLTPTTFQPGWLLGGSPGPAELGTLVAPFSLSLQPALSLPLHWTDGGLPVGV